MISRDQRFGRVFPAWLVLASGMCVPAEVSKTARGDECDCAPPALGKTIHDRIGPSKSRSRPSAAFDGFGLSYHLGYGYGGLGRGVGPFGGYPHYGGPGYPQCSPPLQRFGGIAPFHYNGKPAFSRGVYSGFEGVGPLVVDPPVVDVGNGRALDHSSGFGPFTGALPYPSSYFAPFAAEAGATR